MDYRKKFPPFWGFSTKTLLVTRGFDTRGYPLPPKIRDLQGPPVQTHKIDGFANHLPKIDGFGRTRRTRANDTTV